MKNTNSDENQIISLIFPKTYTNIWFSPSFQHFSQSLNFTHIFHYIWTCYWFNSSCSLFFLYVLCESRLITKDLNRLIQMMLFYQLHCIILSKTPKHKNIVSWVLNLSLHFVIVSTVSLITFWTVHDDFHKQSDSLSHSFSHLRFIPIRLNFLRLNFVSNFFLHEIIKLNRTSMQEWILFYWRSILQRHAISREYRLQWVRCWINTNKHTLTLSLFDFSCSFDFNWFSWNRKIIEWHKQRRQVLQEKGMNPNIELVSTSSIENSFRMQKNILSYPVLTSQRMETTTFSQLKLRVNVPYVYVHQGSCEHRLVFTEVR